MKLIIKILLNAVALYVVAFIIPDFRFDGLDSLFVASIIMGVVNTFIKPVLQILFLPVSIITLGIFAFLINVVLLWGVSYFVPGFDIYNFSTAVISAAALMLVSLFLNKLSEDKNKNK
ncbi:phage holin family protein [Candidatus Woesebacteria bacterium]|nr:phage holin family protein [Candidatus Woesebacteria bacterium]